VAAGSSPPGLEQRQRSGLEPGRRSIASPIARRFSWIAQALVAVGCSAALGLGGGDDRASVEHPAANRELQVAVARGPGSSPAATTGPALAWRSAPNAEFYNVIIWRDGRRVLDAWPKRPSLSLSGRVSPGTYRWFVYPGRTASGRGHRYGALLASGTVVV
jgi:hypothetical protein